MGVVAVTSDDIVTRFPLFEGQEDQIDMILEEVKPQIPATFSDADYKTATMYLVAHLLSTEDGADAFPTTSESLGPISVSYAVPTGATSNSLRNTEYGRRYLAIVGRYGGSGIIVVQPG